MQQCFSGNIFHTTDYYTVPYIFGGLFAMRQDRYRVEGANNHKK